MLALLKTMFAQCAANVIGIFKNADRSKSVEALQRALAELVTSPVIRELIPSSQTNAMDLGTLGTTVPGPGFGTTVLTHGALGMSGSSQGQSLLLHSQPGTPSAQTRKWLRAPPLAMLLRHRSQCRSPQRPQSHCR